MSDKDNEIEDLQELVSELLSQIQNAKNSVDTLSIFRVIESIHQNTIEKIQSQLIDIESKGNNILLKLASLKFRLCLVMRSRDDNQESFFNGLQTSKDVEKTFREIKLKNKKEECKSLIEQWQAVYEQKKGVLSDSDAIRLEKQLGILDQKIVKLEQEIGELSV